ncbi:MAG: hypothetical protein OXE17_05785 [Chloroflexi bacterium]|nr:hypothetical protein [Chloroflexota bacterium]
MPAQDLAAQGLAYCFKKASIIGVGHNPSVMFFFVAGHLTIVCQPDIHDDIVEGDHPSYVDTDSVLHS